MQNQMFRGIIVAEIHSFFDRSRSNQDALRDGLAHDIRSWKNSRLRVHLFFDFGDGFRRKVDREEDDLGVDAVFGLGEEIGSDECWIGGFIGDNLDGCVNRDPFERLGIRSNTPKLPKVQLAYR